MINLEWSKLRPFDGDVKKGFEELVCQLARAEKIPNRDKFIRVAAPDGGVEAYCVLANRDEYGWQAKFFTTMSAVQWKQLDESFKTAFEKHPKLVKYFICLPLDRPDPRVITKRGKTAGQQVKHFMDKWNEKVEEWQSYASSQGRKIEFEYWGTSELFDRLSQKENLGRLYYWFGKDEFSDEWFTQRLKESIVNLGKRYTPELNFTLPFAKIFDGLSRDKFFQEQFATYLNNLVKSYNKSIPHIKINNVKDPIEEIISCFSELWRYCDQIDYTQDCKINQGYLFKILDKSLTLVENIYKRLHELNKEQKEQGLSEQNFAKQHITYDGNLRDLRNLSTSINDFSEFLKDSTVSLFNNPFMILLGEAGTGKSHLLADIAEERLRNNQYTILLLGQQFTNENPWEQIRKHLHLNCDRDTFLAALNSKAESLNSRILIFIDALNEGEGKKLWNAHLPGIIETLKKYPNLGIVFSIRTSYEKLIIPENVRENNEITVVRHFGFSNYVYDAIKLFFNHYCIKQPSVPLLHSEFSNPLFLKLFCESLYKKKLNEG